MATTQKNNPADKEFWNARAATFPRYSPGEHTYEARMLALARSLGADFRGKTVLDIGCGTGMYTIRIAREARAVFALDISEAMLRIFKTDAAAQGLTNVEYVLSGWGDYAPPDRCDMVFCSMSPAIREEASRKKLIACAGMEVLYVDFSWRRPSNVMQGLYGRYSLSPREFAHAPHMRTFLDNNRIPFSWRGIEDKWDVAWEADGLVDVCALSLRDKGVEPDMDALARHVRTFLCDDGHCHEITEFGAEVLFWKNPG